jgi:hypothetical protein
MKKIALITALALFASLFSFAQVGSIQGTILGEDGFGVPGATIEITSGTSYSITSSDLDGRYKLKPLEPGIYSIQIRSLGSKNVTITNLTVKPDKITFADNVNLVASVEIKDEVIIKGRDRLIDPEETSVVPIEREELYKLPVAKNPVDIAASLSTEISKDENNQMIVRGSRPGSSSIYIDGVKMTSEGRGVPSLAVGDMEVYTGGVPAKYGDFTGGVVIMRTASYFDMLSAYESRAKRFQELSEMEKEMEKEKEEAEQKKEEDKESSDEESDKSEEKN